MRGNLLLLHQQRLVQLTLVLLDLLLHVGDCTCNLGEKRSSDTKILKEVLGNEGRKTRRLGHVNSKMDEKIRTQENERGIEKFKWLHLEGKT